MYFVPYRDQVSFLGQQWNYKTSSNKWMTTQAGPLWRNFLDPRMEDRGLLVLIVAQEVRQHELTCRLSLGAHWDWTAIFIKIILCDHCLHDSGLYI